MYIATLWHPFLLGIFGLAGGFLSRWYARKYRQEIMRGDDAMEPVIIASDNDLAIPVVTAGIFWVIGYFPGSFIEITALAALLIALITLTVTDLECYELPDAITLPGIWAGLLLSTANLFSDSKSSIIGAVIGFLILEGLNLATRLIVKRDGYGGGDSKLLALLGAWFGWQTLPVTLMIALLTGSLAGLSKRIRRKQTWSYIPFGPFLVLGGVVSFFFGEQIVAWWQDMFIFF